MDPGLVWGGVDFCHGELLELREQGLLFFFSEMVHQLASLSLAGLNSFEQLCVLKTALRLQRLLQLSFIFLHLLHKLEPLIFTHRIVQLRLNHLLLLSNLPPLNFVLCIDFLQKLSDLSRVLLWQTGSQTVSIGVRLRESNRIPNPFSFQNQLQSLLLVLDWNQQTFKLLEL